MKQKLLLLTTILLFLQLPLYSQFYYVEDCKNSTGIFTPKGDALYTSGNADPSGNGWLRLTRSGGLNQCGYVLTEGSYLSNLGLTVEFDFKVWNSTGGGIADGLSVFLFDGSINDGNFQIGGLGGALGYLPNSYGSNPGLIGGYLGVGIDEYGNFRGYTGGGPNGMHIHAITVAGPANSGYAYIGSTPSQFVGISGISGTTISYPTTIATRPADASYYRRVRVQMDPAATIGVDVSVYLKIDPNGDFVQVLDKVNVPFVPFPTFRVGFAGITGSATAHHEVRNVVIKTSGDLSVYKKVDIPLCLEKDEPFDIETIVTSGALIPLTDVAVQDTLPANFNVSSFNISGGAFHTAPTTPVILADGRKVYSYSVDVPVVGTAIVSWSGYMTSIQSSKDLITSVGIMPPASFVDPSLIDNYAIFIPEWLPEGRIVGTPTFSYDEATDNMTITLDVKNTGDIDFQSPFKVTAYKDNIGNTTKYIYMLNETIVAGEMKNITFSIPNYNVNWAMSNGVIIKVNDNGDGTNDQAVCYDNQSKYRYYSISPIIQDVCRGKVEVITCSFNLGTNDTYQWQSSKNNLTWTDIVGATQNTYHPVNQKPSIVYYRIVVNNNDVSNPEIINSASVRIRVRACVLPVNHNISAMGY